jgi:hypothetical protein
MTKKFTFEFVQKYFKEHGYELLETAYINANTKMKYICNCKNESLITFHKFKQGQRCRKCSGKEKLTFEFVQNFFKKQNCELLETEYINSLTKMKYVCNCGNQSSITFGNFQTGYRCKKCAGLETLTYDFVQKYFKNQQCELLENKYVNNKTKMKYKCVCGNESTTTFNVFQNGHRCRSCGANEKLTYEFVKQFFTEQNCKLLETEYINIDTTMKYICTCGNKSKISFDSFKSGSRCSKCTNKTERIVSEFLENEYTNIIFQPKFEWCKNKKTFTL